MLPSEIKYYQDVAKRLTKAKHGEKTQLVQGVADTLDVSINYVYEKLESIGYNSNRKTRSDRGNTHVDLRDARLVCNNIHQNNRKNKKRMVTFEMAIRDAYANGHIKQLYNATTLSRVARTHGFHPDQLAAPSPHVTMRSLHPNHVWQVDASIGVLFYLPSGGIEFTDKTKHYKNKPENLEKVRRHLCIRYAVVDHFSGAFFHKYYAASGENQEIFFDVLANAFIQRDREDFYGVPQMLVMDKGAANTSHLVRSFLDRMGIQHYAHMAGNPRAKGSAEKIQDIIERQFEGTLKNLPNPIKDVHELNALADKWRIYFNSNAIHTRTKKSRYAAWKTITEDQLILAPEMKTMQAAVFSKPEERKVQGDLTITYKGKGFDEYETYSVAHIPNVRPKEYVTVLLNPFQSPNIDIEVVDFEGNATYYECTPIERVAGNFPADSPVFGEEIVSQKDTVTDIERKQLLLDAHGVNTLKEAEAAAKKNSQLFNGKLDPRTHVNAYLKETENIISIPKRGTEHELQAPKQVLEKISVAEVCKRLKADLGDQYPKDTYQYLSKHYTEIDPMDYEAIKRQLTTRSTLKVVGE